MATGQNPPSSPTQSRGKKLSVVNDPPKLDLETYLGNYSGRTRYERLYLIGTQSTYLGVDALKLAVKEAKKGQDTKRYVDAQTQLANIAPTEPEVVPDTAWLTKTTKQNAVDAQNLEGQLKGYKNNLIKESIRMGNEDLGKHFHSVGELGKAFEAFSRMRQDSASTKQVVDVSRHLIEVAFEQRNWIAVSSNAGKIKSLLSQLDSPDPSLQPFAMSADAVASLDSGNYYDAALAFLKVEPGMGASCNKIVAPNDVAIYGGLCALATMGRNELNTRVLENSGFRSYLELEPHIRRAIGLFVNSRYSECLAVLESYRADYLLDLHLQRHVDDLYFLVRSKSIVQYFIPFSCVTLDTLNEQFAAPGKTIDWELAKMIERKELNARIDTQNRLLIAPPIIPRASLHTDALATAKEYERAALRRIQHMNLTAANLEIVSSKPRGFSVFGDDYHQEGSNRELRSRGGY